MKKYCYINDRITEEKNAYINPYDLGILRSYGVFDFMCTANGKPFHLHDHWKRLENSARSLNLAVPIAEKEYIETVDNLLKKNNISNAGIRTVLTAGVSANGITLEDMPTFYILIQDMLPLLPPQELYDSGAKIITHDFERDNFNCKTTNYVEALKNQKNRNQKNAIEILYTKKNEVLECSTSNIFGIKNDKLFTPKDGILPGITRKIIISLAKKNNIPIAEQKVTIKKLLSADEVFITGSAKHILPITKIDTHRIGSGKPGALTEKLQDIYFDYFNNQ